MGLKSVELYYGTFEDYHRERGQEKIKSAYLRPLPGPVSLASFYTHRLHLIYMGDVGSARVLRPTEFELLDFEEGEFVIIKHSGLCDPILLRLNELHLTRYSFAQEVDVHASVGKTR